MTKIKLISDTHFDFDEDKGKLFTNSFPVDDVDILIIAGDLCVQNKKKNLKRLCDRFPEVIYVLGNHDIWGKSFQEAYDRMNDIRNSISNLYWLQNKKETIRGINFVGTTLWFDNPHNHHYDWPDYRHIKYGNIDIFKESQKAKDFLSSTVQEGDFVITHHLPSNKCINPKYYGNRSNCYFVNDIENIILNNKPAYWHHGHGHDYNYLTIDTTKLYCNPRSYPFEREWCGFKSNLIVEL